MAVVETSPEPALLGRVIAGTDVNLARINHFARMHLDGLEEPARTTTGGTS